MVVFKFNLQQNTIIFLFPESVVKEWQLIEKIQDAFQFSNAIK